MASSYAPDQQDPVKPLRFIRPWQQSTPQHAKSGRPKTPSRLRSSVCEVQVNAKIGFDFAAAMRAFLRADPDVIMVGEIRDRETANVAIEASLTGHLVLSTLHTNSAVETVTRLLEMNMDPFNFADALLGVLAQRFGSNHLSGMQRAVSSEQRRV